MKAKLIKKSEKHYDLRYENGGLYTSTYQWTSNGNLLSIKNCQAIERGYDLYELAEKHYDVHIKQGHTKEDSLQRKIDFILGFQKALEILGDKKFSEEDVVNIAEYVRVASQSSPSVRTKDLFNEYQSLQQTEWDVEIEMIGPLVYPANLPKEGEERPAYRPKLDVDGCLILRRMFPDSSN